MRRILDSGFVIQRRRACVRSLGSATSGRHDLSYLASSFPESRIRNPESGQTGFAFITAIFLLVVMAAFAGFAVNFTMGAQATTAVAVQGVRAHATAQAGVQWATFTLLDPQNTLGPADSPRNCFAAPTTLALPAEFAAFTVRVDCSRFPAWSAVPNYHEEGVQRVAQYVVTVTASSGSPGGIDYVERQIEGRIEVCKDPSAPAPSYACR
jgi:MSHA biogenesis protein MshP